MALQLLCSKRCTLSVATRNWNILSKPLWTAPASHMSSAEMESSVSHGALIAALRTVVPQLKQENYKGQQGKVGVMGGCREYTGAPFFAAMSAMRMGCDLAYVFCTPSAAQVIKGYSPELIVMPMLPEFEDYDLPVDDEGNLLLYDGLVGGAFAGAVGHGQGQRWYEYYQKCQSFVDRLTVLIIGPGLGDDPQLQGPLRDTLHRAKDRNLPLIIDGSGLNFIAKQPELVKGYNNCILTPNIAEFGRLAQGVGLELPGKIGAQWQQQTQQLAAALDGPILLSKGPVDVISDGQQQLVVRADGSPRRCGGQGDVLTGTVASFLSWIKAAQQHSQQQPPSVPLGAAPASESAGSLPPLMLAAYGGCLTMRAAAVLGYAEKGRSMVAGDMIQHLGDPVLLHAGLLHESSAGVDDRRSAL